VLSASFIYDINESCIIRGRNEYINNFEQKRQGQGDGCRRVGRRGGESCSRPGQQSPGGGKMNALNEKDVIFCPKKLLITEMKEIQ
jgi:hypothetical protein